MHLKSPFPFPPTYSNEFFSSTTIFLYMGQGMNEAMERKRPRKLNLYAPLLSTRRPASGYVTDEVSCTNSLAGCKDSSNGIPFCWEQAPGKPKNSERSNNVDEAETPRPKLPPGRWIPPKKEIKGNCYHNHDHHVEGCDTDVDGTNDVFSDAVEVLSLTEAIDMVEKTQKFHGSTRSLEPSDLDGLNLATSLENSDCPSPSFIIERFLPDAIALAASSALTMSKTKLPVPCLCNYTDQSPCVSQAVIKQPSLSSPKGCGLEMLLPWRMKHKLCSVRNPIKEKTSNIVQPKASSTKQKKLLSSIVAASPEWRCK